MNILFRRVIAEKGNPVATTPMRTTCVFFIPTDRARQMTKALTLEEFVVRQRKKQSIEICIHDDV